MKKIFLFLLLFSIVEVRGQSSADTLKGWFMFFDETGLYFPLQQGESIKSPTDFFKTKKRTNGIDLNMSWTDMEKYRKVGVRFSGANFSYGGGLRTITILPVNYKKVTTENTKKIYKRTVKNLEQTYTKFEIMYNKEKYLIGYSSFDSSYITNIVPILNVNKCK